MRAAQNPFNPGSGLRPPALVGRDSDLEAMDTLLERTANGLPGRGLMLSGLRGVGKTVLLNEMRARAENAEWFVVGLEARPDDAGAASARRILARELSAQARRLAGRPKITQRMRHALGSISSFSVSAGVSGIDLGVEVQKGRADSGDIEVDLPEVVGDLSAALLEAKTGFGLFIDEVQDLDASLLRALLVTQHQAGQRGWPFYVVGAGLPNLSGVLAESRSYAERLFDYRRVARLPHAQAQRALAEPVSPMGVHFTTAALDVLLDAADGYPYFLQEYGRAAWDLAAGPEVTVEDARNAHALGLERLDAGFFASRWDRATPSERRLLVAMAIDEGSPSLSSDIASRMGLKITSIGPYRAKLISKGLVYAPDHGLLAYTVPGMDGFVRRHRDEL